MIENIPDINLNERERAILQALIQLYILKATPIGSKNLARYLSRELKLSSATIRNVMAALEDMDLISHPHTSAGRVPTDKGYRFYVDTLMKNERLSEQELKAVKLNITSAPTQTVLKDASKLLGFLSRYLGIVEMPHLKDLIVEKIDLVGLSTNKLLVVLALDSNNVKTVTLEAEFEIDFNHLGEICSYINERISGKPLSFLRQNFNELISDLEQHDMPLVRLFVESVDRIFQSHGMEDRLLIAGTQNLLNYPEFENPEKMKSVIEIIENEDIIIHLLGKQDDLEGIKILIGSEMNTDYLDDYSLVVSSYTLGSASGSIGLIGPKRMNYSKMISLVDYVSLALTNYSI